MGARRSAPRREGGFTLIEMMVTLGILGMLFTMITSIISSFIQTDKRVNAALERERAGSAIMELFGRDLQATYAYSIPKAFLGTDRGEQDRVEFLSTRKPTIATEDEEEEAPTEDGEDTVHTVRPLKLQKVGFFVQDSTSQPGFLTLFRYEQAYVPAEADQDGQITEGPFDSHGEEDPVVFEIYNRIRSFELEYLDADGNWGKGWTEENLIPRAVQITLKIQPPSAPLRTGYETSFERSRKGEYTMVVGLP
ncbi:MAG: prepilin-type N-terminal cleavage/methylation domain-containing protein, partial [Planctomycetota bacterium]